MALLDFLKRKKEVEKARSTGSGQAKIKQEENRPEKKSDKTSDVSVAKQPRIHDGKAIGTKGKKTAGFSYEVIKEPHISEKATNLSENNKYVFKIYKNTNKPEIKKAIEGIYGVNVLNVNIIKIPKKKRRLGRTEGFRKAYNKAVVTIREGQKIEVY